MKDYTFKQLIDDVKKITNKYVGFENASITWGAKQLAAMVKNERIVFGNIIQRSYVWEKARKSLFIHSLAIGVPIPPTYAKRFDDGSDKRNSRREGC